MSAPPLARRDVVRVTQSPMNPKRWALDLSCGHEVWVTARTKPSRKTELCGRCRELGLSR
jgi:hypothetical protein